MEYKKISDIADILNGYAFKSKEYVPEGIRIIRIANVQDGYVVDDQPCFYPISKADEIDKYKLEEGDLLVSLTGNVGRVGLLERSMLPAALNQRVACLRISSPTVNKKYLYYFLRQEEFKRNCVKASRGVAQLNLSTKWLQDYLIPIPKLNEQEMVVSRIEEMLSSLDNAVETLNKTKEQLEVYRQSVLKSIFDGCDKKVTIEAVCEHVTDGDHMPPPKAASGIPFIMISNINENHIDWNETSFVNEEYFEAIGEKRTPKKGDILYTVTGSFGIPVLVNFDKQFCFQRHIALLRPKDLINQKFFYYALQTPEVYAQASKGATGTAQKTVGLGVLRKIKIPFIENISRQKEIVSEVENRLSACQDIDNTVRAALVGAKAMRQSILKKAFEGEL